MRHILVTGGTGRLGRHVVLRLRDAGCKVRVLSRHSREAVEGIEFVAGDLTTGEGIEASVEGVEIIVYCAGRARATLSIPCTWSERHRRLGRGIWCTSRSSAPTVSLSSAALTAPCSATSRPNWPPSAWWLIPACHGQHCAPPSSTSVPVGGAADGQTAGDASPSRVPVPADRRWRGGDPARRVALGAASWPGARHGWTAGVRDGRDCSANICGQVTDIGRSCRSRLPGKAAHAIRAGAIIAPDRAVGQRTWEEFLAERVGSSGDGKSHLP